MKTLCDCDSDPTLFDLVKHNGDDGETQWKEALMHRRISLHLTRNRMSNNESLQQRKGTRDLKEVSAIDASPVLCQCDCRVKNERVAHLTPH